MTWLGWLRNKIDALWTWRRRSELRRAATGAAHNEEERALRRGIARTCARQYPAASARVEARLLLESLVARDPVRLRDEVAALGATTSSSDEWTIDAAAAALGVVIAKLMAHGGDEQLRLALTAFAEFRRQSSASVLEAFPLLESAALRSWHDPRTARGYIEYLWSAPASASGPGDVPGRERVLAALQAACQPQQPGAEALNLLVARWLQLPWANVNLLKWHLHREQPRAALEHWQILRTRDQVPADPALLLEAGALHRRLQQWVEADWVYTQCLQLDETGPHQRQAAAAFQIVSRLQAQAEQLRRGESAAAGAWAELRTSAAALYETHRQAAAAPDVEPADREQHLSQAQILLPVVLHFAELESHPRVSRQRVFVHPGEFTLNGHSRCLLDAGQLEVAPLQIRAEDEQFQLQRGLTLGARGRLTELRDLIQLLTANTSASPQLSLLAAHLAVRSGEVARARAALRESEVGLPRELRLGIEIEMELAQGKFAAATRLLAEPAAALLPFAERELFTIAVLNGNGDWQQAFQRFHGLLAETDCPDILASCGFEGLLAGQDEMAEECFIRAAASDPRHYSARLGEWLAAAVPNVVEWRRLQADERLLSVMIRPYRDRLAIAGRNDLAKRLDNFTATQGN